MDTSNGELPFWESSHYLRTQMPFLVPANEESKTRALSGGRWIVHGRIGGHFARVLIDSGATSFFISNKFITKNKFIKTKLQQPLKIYLAEDGHEVVRNDVTFQPFNLFNEHRKSQFYMGDL